MNIFENKSMPDLSSIKDDYFTPVPEDYQDDIDLEYDVDDEELDGISPAHSLDNREYHTGVKEGDTLLMVRGLNKYYSQGGNKLEILKNVDLRLHAGEITALIGPSGSGKSTLLHILGLLDAPSSGQIFIGGAYNPHIKLYRSLTANFFKNFIVQDTQDFSLPGYWEVTNFV